MGKGFNVNKFIHTSVRKYLNEQHTSISDVDLYNIAKWGLEGYYSSSGCWDEYTDDLEGAIQCAIGDFKLFLSKPYPMELGNIPASPIIYRLIRLKNLDDLDKNNLGVSWFSNPKQTDSTCFFDMLEYLRPNRNEDGIVYLIKAQIDKENIDMKRTLWERSTQWCENEIVVIDESKINLISISEFK